MKRQDAFRKLNTLCQRLDEVDLATFPVVPLRAYLFGSVVTDKPDPADIDVILVHDRPPHFNAAAEVRAMMYGRPLSHNRASTQLRRGMKMVQLYMVEFGLEHWEQLDLLLFIRPKLIWQPGGDWRSVLAGIEANPLPWEGERPENSQEISDAFIESLPEEERWSRLDQALAEIESQEI
ncbi:MAG: hypothetical protein FOGNACKC_00761 [Anaerolineae bacterium]|nr:hypothetical protein [Anaerolineae bacterium]